MESLLWSICHRSHEIIPIDNCLIQNKKAEEVAKEIFTYIKENDISIYDENKRSELIRHIIVKIGVKTNQIMCIIVSNEDQFDKENELVS